MAAEDDRESTVDRRDRELIRPNTRKFPSPASVATGEDQNRVFTSAARIDRHKLRPKLRNKWRHDETASAAALLGIHPCPQRV